MSALPQQGEAHADVETAEPLPRPTRPPHTEATAEPSPVDTEPPTEERSFLMILLRALSAWST